MKIRYAIFALLTGMVFGQGQFSGGGGGGTPGAACGDSGHGLGWTGSAYFCQGITGAALAGGSSGQLQWNNATAEAGVSQWTTNGTTTITGSATSVLDLHLASTGGLLLPGGLATGIVKVTTGTGAITIATAPTGAIVGTTDTQALTNKDLTGAGNTFPTFNQNTTGSSVNFTGNLAGDVTGAQGATVVGKINGVSLAGLATGILKNTTTSGVPSIAVAGDFPTLNQNTTGTAAALTSTPTNCGAGVAAIGILANGNATGCFTPGGLSNPMTTIADMIVGGTAGAANRLAAPTATNGVPQFLISTPSGGVGVTPAWAPAGVPINSQTGTTYTVAATDRASYLTFSNAGAIAVTLPQAGSTGFASNFVAVGCDIGTGAATITPTTSTISYSDGATYTSAASTLVLTTGQCAWIYSDNTNYLAIVRGGGSGGLSGMTAGQVPIAATASTVTSSKALAGSGAGIATGPTSSTSTDLVSFTGTSGQLQDSGILSGNLATAASAAGAANLVVLSNAADKTLKYATADSTTTHALFATAGAPAFRAIANTDLPAIALDKSSTGLANPTADGTFTYPISSTTGFTFAGTTPASVSTATGTNATSLFNVNGVTGGPDSNATGTGGIGSSPVIAAGSGGAGTGTNTVGGAGGSVTLTAGNGGASLGTGANANGGNIVLLPGTAGSGGSGTAGKSGAVQVGASAPAPVIGTAGGNMGGEGTAPTGLSANDAWYANATNHCFSLLNQTTDVGCAVAVGQANTYGAFLQDFSGGTIRVPTSVAGVTNTAGTFQAGADATTTGASAAFTGRGEDVTGGSTASLSAGAATLRGGDNASTGNSNAGGAVTVRGGDATGGTGTTDTAGNSTIRGGNCTSTTGSCTPGTASVTSGGFTAAFTNGAASDETIAAGLGTGNAAVSHVFIKSPALSQTSGTTAQTQVTRFTTHVKAGSTTSATATTLFNVALANNQTAGFLITVHVETTQATPQNCSTTEIFVASVQDTAGTVTSQTTAGSIGTICSTGTLTLAGAFSAAAPSVFSITPTWATIVPTAVTITIQIQNLSQQDIALL